MEAEPDDARDVTRQATSAYENGESQRALDLLGAAIARAPEGDEILRADLLLQKAAWLRESGHADDAATALEAAARQVEPLPRSGHETEWSWLRAEQGLAALQRGALKAADTLLDEAASLAGRSPARDVLRTDTHAARASLQMARGRLGEARDTLLSALDIDQRAGNRRSESNDLTMLGQVFSLLGDDETARVYLRKAYMLAYENGLVHEALAAMTSLAAQIDDAGDHEGAAYLFRQAGEIQAESGDLSGVACNTANQGVAAWLGEDLEAADALFSRSRELHQSAGNAAHAIQDLINRSGVTAGLGQPDIALSYAEQSRAEANEYGLVELLWAAEAAVAKCLVRRVVAVPGRPGSAAELQDAVAGYRRAADIIDLLRSQVSRPEERESLLSGKEAVYDEAIDLCIGLNWGKSAFEFGERARMRSFLDALGPARLRWLARDDPASGRREEITSLLLSRQTPPGDKPALLEELRLLRAQAMASRPVVAALTEAELPSVSEIAAAIPAGTAVLAFYQLEHSMTGLALSAVLINQDGPQDGMGIRMDVPVDVAIERFRDEIEAGDAALGTGRELFGLIRPFLPQLATTSSLIIVPHRSLHRLPFAALWDRPAIADGPRRYLTDRFHLTTVPSASYLSFLARQVPPADGYGPPVVLGNPTDDLSGAGSETERVAARLGVSPLLGLAATRQAFLGAGSPTVLHVACHGQYNKADPLLSGLMLADGPVTVEDLLDRGPAPAVLVLSGCVTGMAKRKPGDELVGLAQAALRNGTRSVIATLWEASDDSSAAFFEAFYDALLSGVTVSEAVTSARSVLASGDDGFDQPVEWAPFLVIGDPCQRLVAPGPAARSGPGAESRTCRRDRLMAALAARLRQVDSGGDPTMALPLALAPAAVADARQLAELLEDADYADSVESRFLIGWLYWYRALALDGEERDANTRIAVSRFYLVFLGGGLPLEELPRPLWPELADIAEAYAERELGSVTGATELAAVTHLAELWQRIALSTGTDHPNRAMRLSDLGVALQRRYEHSGVPAHLDEAIQAARNAVAVIPDGDSHLAGQLANLGRALDLRYDLAGSPADLDEAVTLLERAVSLGAGHPDLAQYQTILGVLLRTRFERTGAADDLKEATRAGRDAIAGTPAGHPQRGMYLSNLSVTTLSRYETSGRTALLEEAVRLGREAVAAAPPGHPDRMICVNNLGTTLKILSQRGGPRAGLEEAIELGREAMATAAPGPRGEGIAAQNLGNALRERSERTGSAADLDEAIGLLRQAVAILEGHAGHTGAANDLARALIFRHNRTGGQLT